MTVYYERVSISEFSFADAGFILRESRHREAMLAVRLDDGIDWSGTWLAENCLGDGFDRHHLLAGSEGCDRDRSVTMSGLVVDNHGVHSHATFCRLAA